MAVSLTFLHTHVWSLSQRCALPFQTYQCVAMSHICSATPAAMSQQLEQPPFLPESFQHSSWSVCSIKSLAQSSPSWSKNPNLSAICPLSTSPIFSDYPLHSSHNGPSLLKVTRHVQASGPLHLFLFLPQVVIWPGSLPSFRSLLKGHFLLDLGTILPSLPP